MKKHERGILSSIINFKCPRCRQGELFKTGTFSFEKPFEMPDACSNCGQDFEPEPGYYYGAMFISYILTGWFCVGFSLILVFGFGWSTTAAISLMIAILAIFFVFIFRISRSIWIHITEKYDPSKTEHKLSK